MHCQHISSYCNLNSIHCFENEEWLVEVGVRKSTDVETVKSWFYCSSCFVLPNSTVSLVMSQKGGLGAPFPQMASGTKMRTGI